MKSTIYIWMIVGLIAFGISLMFPIFAIIFAGLILIIIVAIVCLRSYILSQAKHTIPKAPKTQATDPMVSVHVAFASEPAKVLYQTLRNLSKLNYPNYEVLVIHNNNTDQATMRSVRRLCSSLSGPKRQFKYFHQAKIAGFKAGALNYLNRFTDPHAQLIAIIDADYQVDPEFLKVGSTYFSDPQIGIVQFPQSYRNSDHNLSGLALEYRSFFTVLMNAAQKLDGVIFTGTMGIIRSKFFYEQLAWNEWCITEDTEAGFQIHNLGYRGVYIDYSMGKGLMPYDYLSLIRQRRRWVYGNMQVLKKDLVSLLQNRNFSWGQRASFFSQLLTWFQFDTVILGLLSAISLLYLLSGNTAFRFIIYLFLGLLASLLIYEMYYFVISVPKRMTKKSSSGWSAFLTHRGLTYTMATSWLLELFGTKLGFEITKKDGFHSSDHSAGVHYEYRIMVYAAITIICLMGAHFYIASLGIVAYAILQFAAVRLLGSSLHKGVEA